MASDIHISIAAEPIVNLGGFELTNSMLATIVVCLSLCVFGIIVGSSLKKEKPSKIQNFFEWFIIVLEDVSAQNLGSKSKARPFLGLVLTLFMFIVLSSWLGLIPGVAHIGINAVEKGKDVLLPLFRAPTTDLNATIALALIAVSVIQYAGFSSLGVGGYLSKFFIFNKGPLNFVIGLLELMQEFTRLISFSFRLFGNIFAGEALIAVLLSLTKFNFTGSLSFLNYVGVPIPSLIIGLEVMVAMLQAYVFVALMTVFISTATEPAH